MLRVFVCTSVLLLAAAGACGGSVTRGAPTFTTEGDASINPAHVDAGTVLTPDAAIPGVTRNGWTWANGGPQAADLNGVWGSGADDVWFVGVAGTILHWDGHSFTAPNSGSGATLGGVWGSGPNDVWTAGGNGDGTSDILHWNGSSWSKSANVPAIDLVAVGGSGPSDVWAVGFDGAWHYDGAGWSESATAKGASLRGVWASGPHDAWAVGSAATFTNPITPAALHWDGASWSAVPTGVNGLNETTFGVWGTGASDVWIAGETVTNPQDPYTQNGYLAHWDGSAWGAPFVLPGFSPMMAVTATTADAKAVGWGGAVESWNGSMWGAQSLDGEYEAVWESGPSDAWAVGRGGVIAHFDGAGWTQLTPPPPALGLYEGAAVRANTKADAWVAGNGPAGASIGHWDGHAWTSSSIPAGSSAYTYFHALWGTGPTDVWGAGATSNERISVPRIVHFDGASWKVVYDGAQNGEYATFRAAWGSGAGDVWFAGDEGVVVHWDGTTLSPPVTIDGTTDSFYAIAGTSAHDVWLVSTLNGDENRFHHYDGQSWTTVFTDDTGTLPVTGLYAATETDAWAVGVEGAPAYHFDGSSWSRADAAATHALEQCLAIWGSSANDVWAVGQNGNVEHYDGAAWSAVPLTSDTVVGISGTGPLDVWMLTSAGAILHHP